VFKRFDDPLDATALGASLRSIDRLIHGALEVWGRCGWVVVRRGGYRHWHWHLGWKEMGRNGTLDCIVS